MNSEMDTKVHSNSKGETTIKKALLEVEQLPKCLNYDIMKRDILILFICVFPFQDYCDK